MNVLTLNKRVAVAGALLLSLYWAIFCWGIWEKGPLAVGFNATIFAILMFVIFDHFIDNKTPWKKLLHWIVPMGLIALSFSVYENPYVKIANIIILPAVFVAYHIMQSTPESEGIEWTYQWINHLLTRAVSVFAKIYTAVATISTTIIPYNQKTSSVAARVLIGLGIFVVLAVTIFIPLLMSADAAFAELMQGMMDWIYELLSMSGVARALVFIALSLFTVAGLLAWTERQPYAASANTTKQIDSIIAGVVLGGILLLYVLFLFTQLQSLWVDALPITFDETESLVKRGFWQLFVLSVINVAMFFLYYRRTNLHVQHLLTAFTFASVLLLLSAAKRMGMYVYYYGFSYEKFFASYTVLFAIILFGWLIYCALQKQKRDIVKFLVYLFIWMYAIAAIMPIEQFVLRSNITLSKSPSSRIDLAESRILSSDVYGIVEDNFHNEPVWTRWLASRREETLNKKFYEMNLQDIKLRLMNGIR
jgi:hypothetical protein